MLESWLMVVLEAIMVKILKRDRVSVLESMNWSPVFTIVFKLALLLDSHSVMSYSQTTIGNCSGTLSRFPSNFHQYLFHFPISFKLLMD